MQQCLGGNENKLGSRSQQQNPTVQVIMRKALALMAGMVWQMASLARGVEG